ncbi:OsmC family peroxiredoxin [Flavobacterium sp. CYK-4]|uniref:OsmC family protein n=1 Tax=Flavobacterium lotistagni TaxID=2709660 RepID=UPI00140BBDA5|nr:OsmC family protein [Flavobacterium lotistagni]NHM07553.1 OsmC family peroxiredoxin [Flavobacterium lotistagni]
MEPHTYQVKLNWLSDRKGILKSDVLKDAITVVTPPEFLKGIADEWSPEHLFVAAINSCFMTTFLAVAENSKLEFQSLECNAVGTLDKVDGKFLMTQVELFPELKITDAALQDKALRVMEMSEKACLISNSVNSEVVLHPKVTVQN